MASVLDLKQVAARNPGVDAQKIEQLREIRRVLEKAGVAKKAEYRLSPPLGVGPTRAVPASGYVVRMSGGA